MPPDWTPINDNHAIAVMGAYVEFADPLPERSVRAALKTLELKAYELGLTSAVNSTRLQFKITVDGTTSEEPTVGGRIFTRRADAEEELADSKALEQVRLDGERLVYRTWDYISWEWHSERIQALFKPCLAVLDPIVVFSAVGMEYLDRFKCTGSVAGGNLEALLRTDSDLLAPHIFKAKSLFHSHTGAFVNDDPVNRQLQTCQVDAIDDDEGQRWVNITTKHEYRFSSEATENADALLVYAEQHTNLKDMLAKIITAEQANRIYLKA